MKPGSNKKVETHFELADRKTGCEIWIKGTFVITCVP